MHYIQYCNFVTQTNELAETLDVKIQSIKNIIDDNIE